MPNAPSNLTRPRKAIPSLSYPKPPQLQRYIHNDPIMMDMGTLDKKATPVEIGTRGTVGSLIMQEIRYFKNLELSTQDIPKNHQAFNTTSFSDHSGSTVGSAVTQKKKKTTSGRFLPSICTLVEVSDKKRMIGVSPWLGYRALKSDVPAKLPA
ncbi:hypothetical protein CRG98_011890 [Punica granatum]|uniref:Uncharacterized protein n=1 Tax=Punica granatum TaxID=22663 RepID=A0A2I0KGN6_PUNGR|nr:hypothetical protein CRG98_011890 [Punica granatum]